MSTRTAHLDLRGKVVAITGGARGIGLATANAFAASSRPRAHRQRGLNRRQDSRPGRGNILRHQTRRHRP
ncbi:MAG: hypothetical protein QOJ56_4995 [Mycobacterium sp.]|jgi:NAD(P)-dependent dehydrogenase (short-subunit alcohol dehydrogenase family)|nr:hypothetical protein [Mycobacterium sp.]